MFGLRSRRANRKSQDRKFAPASPLEGQLARLESRNLTAPALWLNPGFPWAGFNTTTAGAQLVGTATYQGLGNLVAPNDPGQAQAGLNSSSVSDTQTASVAPLWLVGLNGYPMLVDPGGSYTMTGSASSNIVDFVNTGGGNGFGNVGNYAVSMSTVNTVSWSSVAPDAIEMTMGTNAAGQRAYTLADDSAPPPGTPPNGLDVYGTPVYLEETYTAHYDPPPPNEGVILVGGGVNLNTGPQLVNGVAVGSLAVVAPITANFMGNATITTPSGKFTIALNPISNSFSGNLVNPLINTGVTTYVTETPTDLRVVQDTPIAALPYSTFANPIVGPNWFVQYNAGLGVTGASGPNAPAGSTDLTTSYSITFTSFPHT